MIASLLLIAMLALPWLACLALLLPGAETARQGRGFVFVTTGLVAIGCLTLVFLQQEPTFSWEQWQEATDLGTTMTQFAWSADRFSLVIVAATMLILAAAAVLLPDDSSAAWMLTLMMIGGVLQLWWLQPVWGIAGIAVLISFVALVLPTAGQSRGTASAARGLWLSTTVGDIALIVAMIAGIGGLGEGLARTFSDPTTVREFAVMRPATGMFVAFWWWIGILGRSGQFPLCVTFDGVRQYRPLAWVVAVGVGVFAVGWRWCDLGHAWWAASPSIFNLVVSGALASAFLCAWFAVCTVDFCVRIAYLTAAHISLAIGPLCTGNDVDRVWASAVVIGSLGLVVWCWCMMTTSVSTGDIVDDASGPTWAKIMTGGETSTVVWQWSLASRPASPPVLPTIASSARPYVGLIVLMWCGISIAAGSWWWGEEPLIDAVSTAVTTMSSERTGDATPLIVPTRPNTSIPLSAMAVALISVAMCSGMRTLLRESGSSEHNTWTPLASVTLAIVPAAIVVGLSNPGGDFLAIGRQCSPALACLALAAMVIGWVWAGWSAVQQQQAAASFAVIQRLGERRLLIPGLLQFGANFPLRGLAQMFRFLDWSVLEITLWGGLRNLPSTLRRFAEELRHAGNGSLALVVWVSGTALVTTIVWLAQTAR